MTHTLDINLLATLAQRALDEQTNGREYMLLDVYNQTRQAYAQFPEDAVIRQVAATIERMADKAKPGTTISQSQISGIYNNFAHIRQDSNFRRVLGHLLKDELPTQNSQNPDYTRLNRVDADAGALTDKDFADPHMVTALSAVFGGSLNEIKVFDPALAQRGVDYVRAELQALGYAKPEVEVMGGDNKTLVYASHFDTNKGRVTVAIPIDLSGGKLVLPSTFVADNKLAELSGQNLNYFVDKKAQEQDFSVPKVGDVLRAVGILTGRDTKVSSDNFDKLNELFGKGDQLALTTPALFVDRKYEDGRPDIDAIPQANMPPELAHLARDFEDSLLEAASPFGREAITAGKRLILTELASAQLKGAQVKFGSETSNAVVYLATVNTPKGPVDIEIPVEMKALGGKFVPLVPSYFVHNGTSRDFTSPQLQHFVVGVQAPEYSVALGEQYKFMVLPELKEEILKAAGAQNYTACETILKHISERFTEEDYRNVVSDYQHALLTKNRMKALEQTKCAKMIQAGKGSVYARCGHYGVPMHQVVNDADGNCRMKSSLERERLNPVQEGGASISNAKVFMS